MNCEKFLKQMELEKLNKALDKTFDDISYYNEMRDAIINELNENMDEYQPCRKEYFEKELVICRQKLDILNVTIYSVSSKIDKISEELLSLDESL